MNINIVTWIKMFLTFGESETERGDERSRGYGVVV